MSKEMHYYHRVTMALDDLIRCRSYCNKMLTLPIGQAFSDERTIYEALYISLIISYGRVFTKSNAVEKGFNPIVKNEFDGFLNQFFEEQTRIFQDVHKHVMTKRHTAIAHSDANSRNYRHYNDSPVPFGDNPYYPFEHEYVSLVLKSVNKLISSLSEEQSRVQGMLFGQEST
ncbi:hypothetical protein ACQSNA_003386 [Vibrio metschnikovii]